MYIRASLDLYSWLEMCRHQLNMTQALSRTL